MCAGWEKIDYLKKIKNYSRIKGKNPLTISVGDYWIQKKGENEGEDVMGSFLNESKK